MISPLLWCIYLLTYLYTTVLHVHLIAAWSSHQRCCWSVDGTSVLLHETKQPPLSTYAVTFLLRLITVLGLMNIWFLFVVLAFFAKKTYRIIHKLDIRYVIWLQISLATIILNIKLVNIWLSNDKNKRVNFLTPSGCSDLLRVAVVLFIHCIVQLMNGIFTSAHVSTFWILSLVLYWFILLISKNYQQMFPIKCVCAVNILRLISDVYAWIS